MQQADAVGDHAREAHLVRDDADGHAVLRELADQRVHVVGELGVERGGRLVEEHDARSHRECARDGHALLLPAGELAGHLVGVLEKVEAPQQLAGLGLDLGRVAALHRDGRVGHVPQDAVVGEEVVVLEDDPEAHVRLGARGAVVAGAPARVVLADGEVAVGEPARVKGLEQGQAAQYRRLAGARRADDRDDLARGDGERHVGEHALLAKALGGALEADGRCGGLASHGSNPASSRPCAARTR